MQSFLRPRSTLCTQGAVERTLLRRRAWLMNGMLAAVQRPQNHQQWEPAAAHGHAAAEQPERAVEYAAGGAPQTHLFKTRAMRVWSISRAMRAVFSAAVMCCGAGLLNFLLPSIFDDLSSFQSWFDFDEKTVGV